MVEDDDGGLRPFDRLDGSVAADGYECVELASSPAAAHVRAWPGVV
jgi:hypothetical protein